MRCRPLGEKEVAAGYGRSVGPGRVHRVGVGMWCEPASINPCVGWWTWTCDEGWSALATQGLGWMNHQGSSPLMLCTTGSEGAGTHTHTHTHAAHTHTHSTCTRHTHTHGTHTHTHTMHTHSARTHTAHAHTHTVNAHTTAQRRL